MQVFVKSLSGPTYSFEVEPTDTIFDLKKQIQLKASIDAEQCNLILYGKQLLNDRTFSDYKILDQTTLHLVLRMRGNGDMLKNHVLNIIPQNHSQNIPVDSTISISFDDSLRILDINKIVADSEEIEGSISYCSDKKILTFFPKKLFPFDSLITVKLSTTALQNAYNSLYTGLDFSFKTQQNKTMCLILDKITSKTLVEMKRENTDDMKGIEVVEEEEVTATLNITFSGKGSIFEKLKEDIRLILNIKNNEEIEFIQIKSVNVRITSDEDTFQLEDFDILQVFVHKN